MAHETDILTNLNEIFPEFPGVFFVRKINQL